MRKEHIVDGVLAAAREQVMAEVQATLQEELTRQFEWLKDDRHDERLRGEISATRRIAETLGLDGEGMREQAKRDSGFAR